MAPTVFWSAESDRGEFYESGYPLILMGDWCGEESVTDTKARNPGKGEEEASTGTVLINRSSARKQLFPCNGVIFSLDSCLLTGDPFGLSPRMIGYSLWFSFNMFVPGIEVFGFKQWVPSTKKIHPIIPLHYNSLATLQRIGGWVLIPVAIAAFGGLFRVS